MITISIICISMVAILILVGMAFLICFVGTQTESIPLVMTAMLIAFFIAYVVIDTTYSIVTETYKLPTPW